MTAAGVVVNLLLNGVGSFVLGALVALGFAAVFRIREGRVRVALLCLPFLKLLLDLAKSVSSSAWVDGVPPGPRSLTLGLGITSPLSLQARLLFQGIVDGKERVFSAGDWIVDVCHRTSPSLLPILATALCVPAVALLVRRIGCYAVFERSRRRQRRSASRVERISLGLRTVEIYEVPTGVAIPYSGGLLRPYICLPDDVASSLPPAERRAVIAHELAHIRFFDLALHVALGVMTDLFWFVPGIRALAGRVAFACELCADSEAIRRGIPHATLASALVRVAEAVRVRPQLAPVTPVGRSRGELSRRVQRLLTTTASYGSRRALLFRVLRWVAFAVAAQSVYFSVLGGY